MAYNKRTWLGRQGTGLNKFSIGGATPVTIVNQPDSVTQVGDALSAGNLNDLEDRIEDAFDDVDTALDTKADEQDVTNLNNALTAIDHRLDNLEQPKGGYVVQNYKDGAITPSGKGAWAIVEGLRGVSRVENRLPLESPRDVSTTGVDITYNSSTGKFTITGQADANSSVWLSPFDGVIAGHVYLIGNTAPNVKMYLANISEYGQYILPTALATSQYLGIRLESGKTYNDTFEVIVKDISVYFGGTIPSDADTIAEIQTNYPHLLTPSEYGTRIVDSSYSGVRAWSRNIFDEQTESGRYDNSGNKSPDTGRIRCVNPLPVTANTTYYVKIGNYAGNYCAVFEYDADGNFIRQITPDASTHLFTTSGNCRYITFFLSDLYGTTYKNDVCINVSDSQNGTYTPYHAPDTLSLTFQGKSAGSVYDQLETNAEIVQEINGQKVTIYKKRETQRIGSYTFDGTENIGYGSGYFQWAGLNSVIARPTGNTDYPNIMMPEYTALYWNKSENMALYIVPTTQTSLSNYIWWRNTAYSDASSFKATLVGKTIYFELADPVVTLSDPILDNTLLTEAGGRMATVQTGTVVDGSFDLGFINL